MVEMRMKNKDRRYKEEEREEDKNNGITENMKALGHLYHLVIKK